MLRQKTQAALFIIIIAITAYSPSVSAETYFESILRQLQSMTTSFDSIQNTILPAIGVEIPKKEITIKKYNNTQYLTTIQKGKLTKSCPQLKKNLFLGSKDSLRSHDVSLLQKFLKDTYYYEGPITGYFGEKTTKALKTWQLQNMDTARLLQEGNLGDLNSLTRSALFNHCSNKQKVCPEKIEKPICENGTMQPIYSSNKCLLSWECVPSICPTPFVSYPDTCTGSIAKSYDKKGCFLGWSCDEVYIPNTAPVIISHSAITETATGHNNTWDISFYDYDSSVFSYTIDWGDGSEKNTVIKRAQEATLVKITKSHRYKKARTYYITFTIRDSSGNEAIQKLTTKVIDQTVYCAAKTDIISCSSGHDLKNFTDTDGCIRHYCTLDREKTLTFSTDIKGNVSITGPVKLLAKVATTTIPDGGDTSDCETSITWGDTATTTVATTTCASLLLHRYTEPGVYTVTAKIYDTASSTTPSWQNTRDLRISSTVSTTTSTTARYTVTKDSSIIINIDNTSFANALMHCESELIPLDTSNWEEYVCAWGGDVFYESKKLTQSATTTNDLKILTQTETLIASTTDIVFNTAETQCLDSFEASPFRSFICAWGETNFLTRTIFDITSHPTLSNYTAELNSTAIKQSNDITYIGASLDCQNIANTHEGNLVCTWNNIEIYSRSIATTTARVQNSTFSNQFATVITIFEKIKAFFINL